MKITVMLINRRDTEISNQCHTFSKKPELPFHVPSCMYIFLFANFASFLFWETWQTQDVRLLEFTGFEVLCQTLPCSRPVSQPRTLHSRPGFLWSPAHIPPSRWSLSVVHQFPQAMSPISATWHKQLETETNLIICCKETPKCYRISRSAITKVIIK